MPRLVVRLFFERPPVEEIGPVKDLANFSKCLINIAI
jgi:hypothetical protein